MALELQLYTNLEEALPAAIEFNFDELKAGLAAFVEKYRGKLIPPEAEAEGKSDRANLNRINAALDEARKRVKAKCLAPYAAFESKVKELQAVVAPVRDALDEQLKAIEERRRGDKRLVIEAFYDGRVGDLAGLVPLDRIWEESWLNKGCADSAWQTELTGRLEKIRQGLASVRGVAPEKYKAEAEAKFLETFDFPTVFSFLEERKRQDLMLEARRKKAEEEAAAREAEEAARRAAAAQKPAEEPEDAVIVDEPPAPATKRTEPEPEEIEEYTLRFYGTRAQLLGLRAYMKANGIRYERVADATEV